MLITPEGRSQVTGRSRPRRDGRCKKPLLRPLLAPQRVLDARPRQVFPPHCCGPRAPELLEKMTKQIDKYAPAGADKTSWRHR